MHLSSMIREIHTATKSKYGSPRIKAELMELGERVGLRRIRRLMKANGLVIKQKHKFKTTKTKNDIIFSPNLLKQNFVACEINQIWVSDITYIKTK